MDQHSIYVGIDVAKARVDVAVRPMGDRREVSNDDNGIAALVLQMQQLNPEALVLEASGGLELPLVAALAAASLPVVVVNPRQVRDFAKATGRLAKTDALDAAVLAHFADAVRSSLASPPGRRYPSPQLAGGPHTTGDDHAGSGEGSPFQCRYGRPAPNRGPHRLAQARAGRPGSGLAPDPPPESCMAGEGRPAAQRARHLRTDLSYPSGIPARTGHSQPPPDRCPGGRSSIQPGQWYPAGQAHSLGWPGQGPHSPLHGGDGCQPLQPSDQGLLPMLALSLSSENVRPSAQGKCPFVWCRVTD